MSEIPTSMIARLIPRYAEPHRRYHTWSHIAWPEKDGGACECQRMQGGGVGSNVTGWLP
jgi:hypothetical protein